MKKILLLFITLLPLLGIAQNSDTTVKSVWQYNNTTPVTINLGVSQFGPSHNAYNLNIRTIYYFYGNYVARMGFGVEYIHNYSGLNYLPALFDNIIYLPFFKIKPFIAVDYGGALSLSRNYKIGSIFNPSIGVELPVSKTINTDLSIGFLAQTYTLSQPENTYTGNLETIDINLGVSF